MGAAGRGLWWRRAAGAGAPSSVRGVVTLGASGRSASGGEGRRDTTVLYACYILRYSETLADGRDVAAGLPVAHDAPQADMLRVNAPLGLWYV